MTKKLKNQAAYAGTGHTGPFADMINGVYEALKIGKERNLSRDFADALKLLRQNGNSGQF